VGDPLSFKPEPGAIPTDPGVYRFNDQHGRVIYVGKAKNLRSRLANYFQPLDTLHPRTRAMVTSAAAVEWTTVATEVEALTLEYTWIKQFEPRFNVKYRDDKSYPYLAITVSEDFPRAQVMRGAKKKGVKYFGPYTHAWAIRETLDLLTRVFPIRTCSQTVFKRYKAQGRPCLLGYIDKCAGPCVDKITPEEHRAIVSDFMAFLSGQTGRYQVEIEQAMGAAAAAQDFEKAAKLRDDAAALAKVAERNAVVLPEQTQADLFALAGDELEAAIQVFYIRHGRVTGQRGWIAEKVEDLTDQELVSHLLQAVYADANREDIPKEILVPHLPTEQDQLTQWLTQRRGSAVQIKVPRRGDKAKLAATVLKNAEQALALHRARRAGDLTTRSQAIKELAEALGLDQAPLRIECYDISHTMGTNQVGSMVVFEDGLPRKSQYRHFTVKGPEGKGVPDDTAAMAEVLTRRFTHMETTKADAASPVGESAGVGQSLASGADAASPTQEVRSPEAGQSLASGADAASPVSEPPAQPGGGAAPPTGQASGSAPPTQPTDDQRPTTEPVIDSAPKDLSQATVEGDLAEVGEGRHRAFAYPPNLVVVDGGIPQVGAARQAMDQAGAGHVAVIGLAKRLEEVFLPGQRQPVVLPRNSEALFLLQRLRDEAHRFAISAHRAKRSKAMTRSALDQISGLGPARQRALLQHFGSLAGIRKASASQLETAPGIGRALAAVIFGKLHGKIDQ